ncbi:hypothetical protein [Aquimarina mytili]|uniref:Replication protein n=1 Tax=Aquimarina mytili TaxID=874423 RepID=A0A936ZV93_9FLAO|nr:hypothetical protein [Aquimarina mytili]MBL0685323.1 hypothetical protein [Aquimarina mytili]
MELTPVQLNYDFGKLFKTTKSYIDNYNKNNFELKSRINANHRATAELITRLYAKQLNKAISRGDSFEDGFPGFKTYNPSLASCKGCTVRTIINHKERLKAAGFIIKEVHHGKTGIELWINPLIFDERVKKIHPLVQEHQEQKNNNSDVNCLINVTGTLQEHHKNTEESWISNFDNAKANELEPAFLQGLVNNFWNYARSKLFPDDIFSKEEELKVLENITTTIYRNFEVKGSYKDWKDYQDGLYERVEMVKRWLDRNPYRWIPSAHLYFHPHNKRNNFKSTYQWFLKQQNLKRNIRNRILIQKAEKEWLDHDKGEGKHKDKSRLQLFRLQLKHLESYRDKTLLKVYENSLQRILSKKLTQ